jgi:hypothetical protein
MNEVKERAANLLNAIRLIKEADAMSGGVIGAGIDNLSGDVGKYLLGDNKKQASHINNTNEEAGVSDSHKEDNEEKSSQYQMNHFQDKRISNSNHRSQL